jgi:histone-lysine N-methyltransferase SETMAR
MWFFHHDNSPAHRCKVCTEYLPSTGLKVLEHPPYSPDLAPCDFALFPYVKNRLKGRWFSNDDLLRAWDDECAQIPEET